METKVTRGEIFTCKRLRMLSYLRERGFVPYETTPDYMNPKFMVWKFKRTPEIDVVIKEYFDNLNNRD